MAADDIARGALHLIRWGKDIVPATADEIAEFGPNAARVKALLRFIPTISDDAAKISNEAKLRGINGWTFDDPTRYATGFAAYRAADKVSNPATRSAATRAVQGEEMLDLINSQTYHKFVDPLAAARRFDMTVPNAPEGFTNAARTLSERGLVSAPKDIELARRISMLPPHIQDVYFNLLQEGSDPMELLAAMKVLGG